MTFSTMQLRALQSDLKATNIRTRLNHGRELSYIEGWHAIAEANRIFGFDAWNRETVETKCITSREIRSSFHAVYVAKVRISVRTKDQIVTREGFGTGEAQGQSLGEAHDKAIKTAETDATKRALATFGKPFGLSLYLSRGNGKAQNGSKLMPTGRRHTHRRLSGNSRSAVSSPRVVPEPLSSKISDETPPSLNGEKVLSQGASPAKTHLETSSSPTSSASEFNNNKTLSLSDSEPISNSPLDIDVSVAPPIDQIREAPQDSAFLITYPPRRREPLHLKLVASQPCLVCGRTPSDAHHLRFAQHRALGRKVSDEFTVPLCRIHHRQLHASGNEIAWWIDMDIDPLPIAQDLWQEFQAKQENARVPSPTRAGTTASTIEKKN